MKSHQIKDYIGTNGIKQIHHLLDLHCHFREGFKVLVILFATAKIENKSIPLAHKNAMKFFIYKKNKKSQTMQLKY